MPSGIYVRTPEMKTGKYIRIKKICNIEGCNGEYFGVGLCKKHYWKQWYQDNKKQDKQYKKDNKEYIAKQMKQYRIDNKEHRAKYNRQYFQTPIGKAVTKADYHNRRTLTRDLTKETIQQVYEGNILKYGTLTCVLCFKPVEFADSSLEHLTPISRGGSNNYDNLGIAHYVCNCKKHTKTLEEWYAKS